MCSSSVTELSLSHAGLRQDYKWCTAMCSKSSYLPSLEGMPCKMWLAVCSMAALTSEGLFYWPSALPPWLYGPSPADACPCLTSNLHLFFSPTCLASSSEAAGQTLSLWWHVRYIRHMAGWLYAEEDNWSQADPALLLQQMEEAWHSIFRQMPPPYSTCLEVGHCTERVSV